MSRKREWLQRTALSLSWWSLSVHPATLVHYHWFRQFIRLSTCTKVRSTQENVFLFVCDKLKLNNSHMSFDIVALPRYFGQPLVILMSPQDVPTTFQDYQHHGSLFTLFLHSPLTAVCYICNVGDVPIHHWERCQGYIEKFVTEASCLVTRCRVEDVGKSRDYIGMVYMAPKYSIRHGLSIN